MGVPMAKCGCTERNRTIVKELKGGVLRREGYTRSRDGKHG